MANNLHHLKARLKSIRSTQKITKAMRLVAISKLQSVKQALMKNKAYSDAYLDLLTQVLTVCHQIDHPILALKTNDKPLSIVFTSDMGLAGGYNQDLYKAVELNHQADSSYIWLGQKGYEKYKTKGYRIINEKTASDQLTYQSLSALGAQVWNRLLTGEITSIVVVYASYLNATSFEVKSQQLLPIKPIHVASKVDIIFDPSPVAILDELILKVLNSALYQVYLQAKTSEYSARRVAMENATDNAQEIIDFCQLEYNKIRQASITQEITEIISATMGG